jgi:hypothetical protein
MGTNCAPLLVDLFLYSYDADFIQRLLKKNTVLPLYRSCVFAKKSLGIMWSAFITLSFETKDTVIP